MKKHLIKAIIIMMFFNPNAQAVPTDYLVLSWSQDAGLVTEYHQVVDLPVSKTHEIHDSVHETVLMMGEDNSLVGEISLKNARFTRAEFHGHDHIDGQILLNEKVVFVIRAQQGLVTQILLPESFDKSRQQFNFNTLIKQAKVKGPQSSNKSQGNPDNRINLLFMGDGYTSDQQADFNADVDSVVAYMQTFEPYQSYANFVSFDRLFTPSNEAGADKPGACFNPSSFVDTAFDAKYCTNNIERLLTVSGSKIFTAAANIPNWDEITVIVNDDHYGGAGGSFSTISTNPAANDVFIHEYGHSFTNLADEYTSPYPGFPSCSDLSGNSPCEDNVTDETARNEIKWSYLIEPSIPIPTPETSAFNSVVGLFEGARYLETDIFRPQLSCNMGSLGVNFCAVCLQAYVQKVYAVPYAAGNSPLSLIEPDSAKPIDTSINGMVSVPMSFSIDTLQPTHGLEISWFIAGINQGDKNTTDVVQNFEFIPQSAGMIQIKVTVKDSSDLVDSSQHNALPTFEQIWQVDVQPFVDLIFTNDFDPPE